MRTVLVTGFEPFGGETVNASWEAARALDGWRSGDLVASALMLPVAYIACVAEFAEAFERLEPDAVLLTGQAARRATVSVERFAHSGASAIHADNHGVVRGGSSSSPLVGKAGRGVTPSFAELTAAGVAALAFTHGATPHPRPPPQGGREPLAFLETTADMAAVARAIRATGIPSRVSTNAGDYVCNHLYYGALRHLVAASPSTPAVFVHLPATPEQTPPRASRRRLATNDAVRALQAAATALIA